MTEPDSQVEQLERQVRLLAAGLGLQVEDPASVVPPEALALARDGKRIGAVRALRKAGFGLVAAKRVVDAVG
jgi:hypothetical protein